MGATTGDQSFGYTWAPRCLTTGAIEYPLERDVSRLIGNMPFLWVEVPDAPGVDSDRRLIERNAVALLSNRSRPVIDPPSSEWLGRRADRPAVRESGLWNVNGVDDEHDPAFLEVFERYVLRMGGEKTNQERRPLRVMAPPSTTGSVGMVEKLKVWQYARQAAQKLHADGKQWLSLADLVHAVREFWLAMPAVATRWLTSRENQRVPGRSRAFSATWAG